MEPVSIRLSKSGIMLAARAQKTVTWLERLRGWMGKTRFEEGEGLWIAPCSSIHTFFMSQPIDVIFINRKGDVVKVFSALRPWRAAWARGAYSVIELPVGTLARSGPQAPRASGVDSETPLPGVPVSPGDLLEIKEL